MQRFFKRKIKPAIPEIRIEEPKVSWQSLLSTITDELFPCPFCGGIAKEISTPQDRNHKYLVYAECQSCRARSAPIVTAPDHDHTRQLKDLWNRRTESKGNPYETETAKRIRVESANADGRCSYCSMPKEHMAECAKNGGCRRLNDILDGSE